MTDHAIEEPVSLGYVEKKVDRPTMKAILFVFDVNGEQKEEWVPRSQISFHDEVSQAVAIPPWLARAKGLIE